MSDQKHRTNQFLLDPQAPPRRLSFEEKQDLRCRSHNLWKKISSHIQDGHSISNSFDESSYEPPATIQTFDLLKEKEKLFEGLPTKCKQHPEVAKFWRSDDCHQYFQLCLLYFCSLCKLEMAEKLKILLSGDISRQDCKLAENCTHQMFIKLSKMYSKILLGYRNFMTFREDNMFYEALYDATLKLIRVAFPDPYLHPIFEHRMTTLYRGSIYNFQIQMEDANQETIMSYITKGGLAADTVKDKNWKLDVKQKFEIEKHIKKIKLQKPPKVRPMKEKVVTRSAFSHAAIDKRPQTMDDDSDVSTSKISFGGLMDLVKHNRLDKAAVEAQVQDANMVPLSKILEQEHTYITGWHTQLKSPPRAESPATCKHRLVIKESVDGLLTVTTEKKSTSTPMKPVTGNPDPITPTSPTSPTVTAKDKETTTPTSKLSESSQLPTVPLTLGEAMDRTKAQHPPPLTSMEQVNISIPDVTLPSPIISPTKYLARTPAKKGGQKMVSRSPKMMLDPEVKSNAEAIKHFQKIMSGTSSEPSTARSTARLSTARLTAQSTPRSTVLSTARSTTGSPKKLPRTKTWRRPGELDREIFLEMPVVYSSFSFDRKEIARDVVAEEEETKGQVQWFTLYDEEDTGERQLDLTGSDVFLTRDKSLIRHHAKKLPNVQQRLEAYGSMKIPLGYLCMSDLNKDKEKD